jgi:hypothetical protein
VAFATPGDVPVQLISDLFTGVGRHGHTSPRVRVNKILHTSSSLFPSKLGLPLFYRLDRKRQRKVTDWADYHHSYCNQWLNALTIAKNDKKKRRAGPPRHDAEAFNEYLEWFLLNSRVSLFPPAYEGDILEKPTDFNDISDLPFNRAMRKGGHTQFAPTLNFVVFMLTIIFVFFRLLAYMFLFGVETYILSVP